MARQKIRQYKTGKIVIYGNSVPKVKKLAEQLGCNAYFYDVVGISALGMGVDILDIWCIIYIDWLWSILDYAQESGWAGRDRLRSEAIIIGQEGNLWICNDKTEAEKLLV
jgi:superfamily II DNA helicase RecQ